MNKSKKKALVKELADKFGKAKITIFSDFHGISVAKLQALRKSLKKDVAEYKVSKKTLLDRALAENEKSVKTKELQGELGVTFGYADEVTPAKTLVKFRKGNETFKILGGLLGSRILTEKDVMALAKLPSREIMLATVVGTLSSPIRALATALQGNIRNLVVVLTKLKESRS